ncbi:hypothetical protein ACN47E_000896 [Coniothyrium glycines]
MSWEIGFDLDLAGCTASTRRVLPEGPLPKRRKIQLACNRCRLRKTRCDGRRPACSSCERLGSKEDCLYEEGTLNTRKHIKALETRLEQLEQGSHIEHMRNGNSPVVNQHISHVELPRTDSPQSLLLSTSNDVFDRSDAASLLCQQTNHAQSTTSMASTTDVNASKGKTSDALATVSTFAPDPDILYGASSTISFVNRVLLTTGESGSFDEQPRLVGEGVRHETRSMERYDNQEKELFGLELLPIRRISDSYVKSYWDVPQTIFPILHEPTFMRYYDQIWSPKHSTEGPQMTDNPIMLATLNLVLALGCRITESVPRGSRASLSEQFYQRARRLVPIDSLDVASLPAVQMLLLTAVYLQSTTYSSRCWNIVGLALRVAQSLGLHLQRSASKTCNQREREIRRRIWYTCVTLDRWICTAFGRPAMVPSSSLVPLPRLVDDEYLLEDGEGTQPVTSRCRIASFVHNIALSDILNEVLHSFYAEDNQSEHSTTGKHEEMTMPDLHEMLRLNSKLDRFLEGLPRYLRLNDILLSLEPPTCNALLQARVLYSRFLYTRLLLLRPVVLFTVRSASSKESVSTIADQNSLGGELARRIGQVCRTTAHDLITVLHQNMGSVYRSSAWWTIYFTFGAAITVLASKLCCPQDDTDTLAEHSVLLAMEIFEYYTPEVGSATQAIQVLKGLQTRLSRSEKQGDDILYQQVQQPQRSDGPLHYDSVFLYSPDGTNVGSRGQIRTPDPLSEDWFTNQALNFNFQDLV